MVVIAIIRYYFKIEYLASVYNTTPPQRNSTINAVASTIHSSAPLAQLGLRTVLGRGLLYEIVVHLYEYCTYEYYSP
eukprot:COSAG02_NODE_1729_length_11180_cov_3.283368_2_plen_77_part_00